MSDQPTPEAIEAVADSLRASVPEVRRVLADRLRVAETVEDVHAEAVAGFSVYGRAALAFIRDAIHRDGADADAIRETLGLHWAEFLGTPRQEPARRVVGEWQETQP